MNQNLNLAIAFGAGFLTFLSPCFLPLIPAYLVYLTGQSVIEIQRQKLATLLHALCFIIGFSLVFIILGIAANVLGQWLYAYKEILRYLGAALLIMLGLYLMGALKLSWLDLERRLTPVVRPAGYLGSVFIGIVFAVGWSPCVGPILAGILLLASQQETITQGIFLLMFYAFGLAAPLLLVTLMLDYLLSALKKVEKYLWVEHYVSGLALIIIGLLLLIKKI
jgi:cytochrome c-type biogenesis protein